MFGGGTPSPSASKSEGAVGDVSIDAAGGAGATSAVNTVDESGNGGATGSSVASGSGLVTDKPPSPEPESDKPSTASTSAIADHSSGSEKRSGNGSSSVASGSSEQKKRRSSGVSSRASSLLASAKNTFSFSQSGRASSEASSSQTPLQKLGRQDAALAVPQGQHNNSAGESIPGPSSTFRVGVWEDRNKKCRRTMEDTHAFLYNFLRTPGTVSGSADVGGARSIKSADTESEVPSGAGAGNSDEDMLETDNGYFAIFDGHAGTFAADWCGKKLHLILEDTIRKNPNAPIPELLDQTFTSVDVQLEKLPIKNSGCTAAIAVLRWEDRVPSSQSVTGSQNVASNTAAAAEIVSPPADAETTHTKPKASATRQRVLYTANVGDARIILCRGGKALRLSYDHKGSDENEGRRIANAGGLILNNRVNGVLAVTRALGDTYIKDLVTGHPYTTETVIQPETDEFIIIACDGLWDVCTDQDAVNLVRNVQDPAAAAKMLVDHALAHFSTDNLSCMIVRLDRDALVDSQKSKGGVASTVLDGSKWDTTPSEADTIVNSVKQKIADGEAQAIGVSATNSGRGHGPPSADEAFKRTAIKGSVEEEPSLASDDAAGLRADRSVAVAVAEAEAAGSLEVKP
ncbi:protein phosphatase [Grosmannia clavigera kw1407]|uniref:Protein phosphatase n=1 Tax=Grosmannia clavigera (strain kw1407 / UAMH 11150) TaxID=655863 RepID=F0XHK3_GROCL|nr:protein phosphatase [Grosmannia clavigera kw1407]EFX02868.1 protein phosphatase [Grosmannia clavigera kw1407]